MSPVRESQVALWPFSASEERGSDVLRRAAAALALSGLAWTLAWIWATRDLSVAGGAVVVYCVVIVALAVVVPWAIASVEHRLLGTGSGSVEDFVLAAGASSVAFALLTLVPAADLRFRWLLLLGLLPVVAHVVAVWLLARVDRRAVTSLGVTTLGAAVVVAVVWSQKVHVPLGELVWHPSDQREYALSAHQLVAANPGQGRYPLGLPLILSPYALLADSYVGSSDLVLDRDRAEIVLAANRLNVATLPTMLSITAIGFWLAARAAVASVGARLRGLQLAVVIVPMVVAALYLLCPPGFTTDRNAGLVPRRLLGIVFSSEPLTYVYAGAVLLLVASATRSGRAWSPWLVGGASGLAVMLRESNIILVALVFGVLLTVPGRRRLVGRTVVAAGAVMAIQAAYFLHVYGDPIMPNREIYNGENWREYAESRYGWDLPAPPPRMDASFIQTNLADVLGSYWVAAVLVLAAAAFVAIRHPPQWRTWLLAVTSSCTFLVFHAAYVHHLPIYRYNWAVVPMVSVLAGAALASFISRHVASGSEAGRARGELIIATSPANDRRGSLTYPPGPCR